MSSKLTSKEREFLDNLIVLSDHVGNCMDAIENYGDSDDDEEGAAYASDIKTEAAAILQAWDEVAGRLRKVAAKTNEEAFAEGFNEARGE